MAERSARPARGRLFLLVLVGLVAGCGQEADAPDDAAKASHPPETARIVSAHEALATAHVATLDPASLRDAEIAKTLGPGARCEFRYTSSSQPVLAMSRSPDGAPAAGLVKLNGNLVSLRPGPKADAPQGADQLTLVADPIRLAVKPSGNAAGIGESVRNEVADLIFEVGKDLKVGYRGYLNCSPEPTKSAERPQSAK